VHVFVLIDLISQAEFIPYSLRKSQEAFLTWLGYHGEVTRIECSNLAGVSYPAAYRFRSRWGLEAAFWFSEDGRLVFVGDHYSWAAWAHHDEVVPFK
jgi:hypothetical protein